MDALDDIEKQVPKSLSLTCRLKPPMIPYNQRSFTVTGTRRCRPKLSLKNTESLPGYDFPGTQHSKLPVNFKLHRQNSGPLNISKMSLLESEEIVDDVKNQIFLPIIDDQDQRTNTNFLPPVEEEKFCNNRRQSAIQSIDKNSCNISQNFSNYDSILDGFTENLQSIKRKSMAGTESLKLKNTNRKISLGRHGGLNDGCYLIDFKNKLTEEDETYDNDKEKENETNIGPIGSLEQAEDRFLEFELDVLNNKDYDIGSLNSIL